MKKLFGIITALVTLLLVTVSLTSPQSANAADVRSGNTVILSGEQNLKDLYLFGGTIEVNAPVTNDLVVAGGNINLTGDVSNDLLAAGGTITVHGKVGNTARIAGGTITVDGPVAHDLVVAGGTVTITKTAAVGGDVLIAGGQLNLEGPVKGKVLLSGGTATLNNTVGGSVSVGRVGTLTLGPQAKINGNLTYSSQQPLTKNPGSTVVGQTTYHHIEKEHQQPSGAIIISALLYKIVIDIILSLLLIYIFKNGLVVFLTRMKKEPWKNLGIGFVYAIAAPLASFILLIFLPLGIASFLLYGLVLIGSIYIAKVFVGWSLMTWWRNRENHSYQLDWRAGVIGPIVFLIIALIPILGWLVTAIITIIAIGVFLEKLVKLISQLQTLPKKK